MKKVTIKFEFEVEVPEFVKYVAMDQNGDIWGFESKPVYKNGEFHNPDGTTVTTPGHNLHIIHDTDMETRVNDSNLDMSNTLQEV